jgi:hypothetical protein
MHSPCDDNLRPSCRSAGPANASRAQVASERASSACRSTFFKAQAPSIPRHAGRPSALQSCANAQRAGRAPTHYGRTGDTHCRPGPGHRLGVSTSGTQRRRGSPSLAWSLGPSRSIGQVLEGDTGGCSALPDSAGHPCRMGMPAFLSAGKQPAGAQSNPSVHPSSVARDERTNRADSVSNCRRSVRLVLAPRSHALRPSSTGRSLRGACR